MRSIVSSTFVSLDGVINHMDKWHFDYVDAESDAFALEQLTASDAMLMGRKTYEVYASAWPNREGAYPGRINELPKYVASSTLTDPTWNNGTTPPCCPATSSRK
jgi:dihydrofolate reductase